MHLLWWINNNSNISVIVMILPPPHSLGLTFASNSNIIHICDGLRIGQRANNLTVLNVPSKTTRQLIQSETIDRDGVWKNEREKLLAQLNYVHAHIKLPVCDYSTEMEYVCISFLFTFFFLQFISSQNKITFHLLLRRFKSNQMKFFVLLRYAKRGEQADSNNSCCYRRRCRCVLTFVSAKSYAEGDLIV